MDIPISCGSSFWGSSFVNFNYFNARLDSIITAGYVYIKNKHESAYEIPDAEGCAPTMASVCVVGLG